MAVKVKFPIYGENLKIFWFDLRGKFMGKIYGENLWGKFMEKIYGENLWESQQFKIMSTNDPPAPSGGGWMGHPITTRGRWRVFSGL
jgi:hypothetical protein